jgi:hypothetical protein
MWAEGNVILRRRTRPGVAVHSLSWPQAQLTQPPVTNVQLLGFHDVSRGHSGAARGRSPQQELENHAGVTIAALAWAVNKTGPGTASQAYIEHQCCARGVRKWLILKDDVDTITGWEMLGIFQLSEEQLAEMEWDPASEEVL